MPLELLNKLPDNLFIRQWKYVLTIRKNEGIYLISYETYKGTICYPANGSILFVSTKDLEKGITQMLEKLKKDKWI